MALLRLTFWTTIFVASTFAFTVLFEHGFSNFSNNARKEFEALSKMFGSDMKRKGDHSDALLK